MRPVLALVLPLALGACVINPRPTNYVDPYNTPSPAPVYVPGPAVYAAPVYVPTPVFVPPPPIFLAPPPPAFVFGFGWRGGYRRHW